MRSVRLVYTAWVKEWERAKNAPTFAGIRLELTRNIRPGDSLAEMAQKLDDASVKDDVLRLLEFARYRRWNESPIHGLFCRAVAFAATEGDQIFFRRLGRVLEREAIPFHPPTETTPIEDALTADWINEDGFCLCWCSDEVLTELLCITKLHCSFQAVRKARQRLGLKKPRSIKLRHIRQRGVEIKLH